MNSKYLRQTPTIVFFADVLRINVKNWNQTVIRGYLHRIKSCMDKKIPDQKLKINHPT